MNDSETNVMSAVWKELDRIALLAALLIALALVILYFVLIPLEGMPQILREFVSSIT
jgi:hypothetical protein